MAENRQELNRNLAQMLKGGVIMDVTTPEQAKIAEAAGKYEDVVQLAIEDFIATYDLDYKQERLHHPK
jgi:pyridoxal biosynthesis lyase PdxS